MTLQFSVAPILEGSGSTAAYGIDDFGRVLGFDSKGLFLEQNGHFSAVSFGPLSAIAIPAAINNLGEIVGVSRAYPQSIVEQQSQSFRMLTPPYPGTSRPNAVNDFGTVVGVNLGPGTSEFGWSEVEGKFSTIRGPGGLPFDPTGINDLGTIVGYTERDAFLDQNGTFSAISVPGRPVAINNFGLVVGSDGDGVYAELGGHTATFQIPGAEVVIVSGVNDAGQIAGYYGTGELFTPDFTSTGFVATPELSAPITLDALGLVKSPSFLLPKTLSRV